jgi:hypothetical protein
LKEITSIIEKHDGPNVERLCNLVWKWAISKGEIFGQGPETAWKRNRDWAFLTINKQQVFII